MSFFDISQIRNYFLSLQQSICSMLETEDASKLFFEDPWIRDQNDNASIINLHGNGITKILKQGAIIEQAGVNFSHIKGKQLPNAATKSHHFQNPKFKDSDFEALGVSTVIHPQNPYIPTAHANLRFFQCQAKDQSTLWWFGGGFDLTPYYPFEEDCQHWHQIAKEACDPFGLDIYPKFKTWCDDYFYLKHRQEARGIGGLFFDDLNPENGWSFENSFNFIQNISSHFIKAYQPIISKRKNHSYGDREKDFQCYRRGRYVEFNLIYDRGTLFGLQSGGRVESILMSLPPEVKFEYNRTLTPNSPEEKLTEYFLKPKDWLK